MSLGSAHKKKDGGRLGTGMARTPEVVVQGVHKTVGTLPSASDELSDRCIAEGTQHGIDACLIAGALCLEPLQYVLLHAQRDSRFRWLRVEATADDAVHNMTDISLRMLGSNRHGRFGLEPNPVSF